MRRALAAALLVTTSPALAQATLPGGASALNEAHGSWTVNCTLVEAGKDCAFSQTAGNPQTGTALVAVELAAPSGNKAEGMLLTAFGLRLDAGVRLGIDGQQLGEALPFLTCVSTGCLVPLDLDEVALSAMKVGTTLEVTGVKVDDGQPVTVPLSLAGFTAAYNRTAELAQ
ncbi:invasion associated locus B family protein [Devosia sp. A16]|uniref:invasion associated locus B family protein n=1 Tax=Devosia sp. A16 TaxID=1736675 RepID=UPI000B2C0DB8|nr:invasion associated locus B family protein [Devosia sp. A16]